jgi:hypothetical protein
MKEMNGHQRTRWPDSRDGINHILSLRSLRSLRLKSFVDSCRFVKFVSRFVLTMPG